MEDITLDDPFAEATAPGEAGSAVRGLTLHWMFLDLAISLHWVLQHSDFFVFFDSYCRVLLVHCPL